MSTNGERMSCYRCNDTGYLTSGSGRWALAARCPCRVPCQACEGAGRTTRRGPDGRVYVSECECWSLDRRIRLFDAAHLPAAYHGKRLEDFDAEGEKASEVVRWLENIQSRGAPGIRGVLLIGDPGVGKTHIVCAVLRFLLLERGIRCRYIDSFQLLQELRATFDAGSGSSALMEEITTVPILALDELGKTRPTGWQADVLDQVISTRYDARLSTFVVSNYGLVTPAPAGDADSGRWQELARRESLQERVGARIYSRLMGMCRTFHIEGPDRRQQG